MEVIPSLDLRDGRVVRLEQGDYERETVYDSDPAAVVRRFASSGATRLHVVDLEAARDGSPANEPALRAILDEAGELPVQVGGGVRSLERADALLSLGVDRVIMGTAALEDPDLLCRVAKRHPGRVILGLDARDGRVAVRGWREVSDLSTREVLDRFSELPLAGVLHTDIARDGLLGGPNLEATAGLAQATRLPVIASGGVGSVEDLVALARTRVIAAAIVGRALYTGHVDLERALREVAAC